MKYFKATEHEGGFYNIRRTTGNTELVQGRFVWDEGWKKWRFQAREGLSIDFDANDLVDLAYGLRGVR